MTTIYVTHDQVEAMTMGDRVAVIRKGKLQQVDTPQNLYDHPVNLFVAGFIGSPAMNMVEATLVTSDGSASVTFGGVTLAVPSEVMAARPGLARSDGRSVVLGMRPEDIEDASLVPEAPDDRRIRTVVDLRESLGADVVVHFTVQAPPVVTEDTKELAHDVGHDDLEVIEQRDAGHSEFLARLNPRTTADEWPADRTGRRRRPVALLRPGDGPGDLRRRRGLKLRGEDAAPRDRGPERAAVAHRPLQRVEVDVDDPEPVRVPERPLEVVQQRPHEIAAQGHALLHRDGGCFEVAVQVAQALGIPSGSSPRAYAAPFSVTYSGRSPVREATNPRTSVRPAG